MTNKHPDQHIQELVERIRAGWLKSYNRLQAAREKQDVKTFADLLESLPAYRQALIMGTPRSRAADLLREAIISLTKRQISTAYHISRHPKEDFLIHYCVRHIQADFEDLAIGRVSREVLNELNPVLDQADKLPLTLMNHCPNKNLPVIRYFSTLKDFKVIALDNLDSFLSDNQPEDPQTQRLSLLQTFKQFAEELDQTYLVCLDSPNGTLDGILRTEASEIPDLILRIQVILWKENTVYRLEALKNTRGELFTLDLLYDKNRHLFVEL